MDARIRKTVDGRHMYWTGLGWVSDPAIYATHEEAVAELEQHADDEEFAAASVVDVE